MVTAIAAIKIGRYVSGYDPFLADFAINAAKFTGMWQNVAHIPLVKGQDEAYFPSAKRKQCDLNEIKNQNWVYGSSSLGEQVWPVQRIVCPYFFLCSPMMSALTLDKHTCHFCKALERAALSVLNVMEDFMARIQTANRAAAMAARCDNDEAKALMLQG